MGKQCWDLGNPSENSENTNSQMTRSRGLVFAFASGKTFEMDDP
jgi:hypothetical protein